MMWFDLYINEYVKATVEILNVKGDLNGICMYKVKITQPKGDFPVDSTVFYIEHDRRNGMWKLMELVCAKIHDIDTKDD